ncbi:hypothetical protein [Leifsonia aquatica]|nr:hypothetical protein [Leifsonia aquatica]
MSRIDYDPRRPNGAAVAAAVIAFGVFAPAALFTVGAIIAAGVRAVMGL